MEASSSGAASTASTIKLRLLDLPAENLSQVVSYIPKKSLFPLLTVSKRFHHLASAALYRNLWFSLAQSDLAAYHRDSAYRLSDALHTFLTSSYDYAQHVKSFNLRMVDSDHDQIQKRIAAKFLAREEAGKLLNTALLVVIKRAKGLEQFTWQVPIECSHAVYQALATASSLQMLHIHLDIASVSKHSYQSFAPPPPSAPVFGGQSALWWDPMSSNMYPPGSVPLVTTGGKASKTGALRTKAQGRSFGSIKGLHNLSITAIDDLSCLEEISFCLRGSSGTLKTLTLSFAESLVSRSQKPHPNNTHNNPPIQDDDATTEPGSPNLAAVGSVPTDVDLKREKQAQEQALARIFSLGNASNSNKKQDRRVERSLKRSAKSTQLTNPSLKSLDKLAAQIMVAIESSTFKPSDRTRMQGLLQAVLPPLQNGGLKAGGKSNEGESTAKKNKWPTHASNNPVTPTKFNKQPDALWSVNEEYAAGASKEAQDYLTQLADFDFDPGSSNSAPTNTSNGWSQGGPLALASNTSKSAFPFNDDALFPSLAPKAHNSAPIYPVSSQSSYSFHPNSSSQVGNSVSQPLPLYGATPHLNSPQAKMLMLQVVQKAYQVGLDNPDSVPEIDALLQTLPPNLYQQAKLALTKHTNLFLQNHAAYSTKSGKKKPLPAAITPTSLTSGSSTETESDSAGEVPNIQPAALTANNTGLSNDQDSDFDMDHPDVVESEDEDTPDNEDEQEGEEVAPGSPTSKEEAVAESMKDKGKQKVENEDASASDAAELNGTPRFEITIPSAEVTDTEKADPPKTMEEMIQEYIRLTHGLSIEELVLCFIPLKSSILARALDLTILRRVVFYNVGAQGAFWTMIEKLIHQGVAFNFTSLYTDDVSPAFVSCLASLPGLKSLHLLRRSSKEFSSTSSKPPATLSEIHKIALTKHFETLQSLSITNLEDESWDIDDKLIRILALKAKKLRELAVSVDSNGFHTFLRCLPGLRNLAAFHLINIKISGSPGMMPHSEWKKLVLDVVCYFPALKLKYVAISLATTAKVSQIGEKPKTSVAAWYKKSDDHQQQQSASASAGADGTVSKGKGKAKATDAPAIIPPWPGAFAPGLPAANDDESDTDADGRPNAVFSKQLRPSVLADSYVIFSNLVLKGRL